MVAQRRRFPELMTDTAAAVRLNAPSHTTLIPEEKKRMP
jgi:hypothetical protein